MYSYRLPRAAPYWSGATFRAILDSLVSGSVTDGSAISGLRSVLIETLGVEDALLCGSGSLALEVALRACGVGQDDEVILPAFCCTAVVPPILAVGALPVLADVGEELNIAVETVDAAITKKTKAIIVPHLFGNPADIESIVEIARAKSIRVIDDAAQALGATLNGRPAGSFGDAGIVSFGDEKICFGLGGGALISNRPGLISGFARQLPRAQPLPNLRRFVGTQFYRRWRRWTQPLQSVLPRQKRADPDAPPARYGTTGMANLQAAVALSLVQTLDENIAGRRARVDAYRELLGNEVGLELIPHRAGSACLTQVVRVPSKKRGHDTASALIAALGDHGFEVQGSYVPLHLLGSIKGCVWDALPRTERVWADLIELPCEPSVRLSEVERISSVVAGFCRANHG
jgi:dTDP-4-amino-4,6-dideoxygalactose transaminase